MSYPRGTRAPGASRPMLRSDLRPAIRLLSSFVQLDADAKVLAAFAHDGYEQPKLRRALARAAEQPVGLPIARLLVDRKLRGQARSMRSDQTWRSTDGRFSQSSRRCRSTACAR